jgi:hypothetical protein
MQSQLARQEQEELQQHRAEEIGGSVSDDDDAAEGAGEAAGKQERRHISFLSVPEVEGGDQSDEPDPAAAVEERKRAHMQRVRAQSAREEEARLQQHRQVERLEDAERRAESGGSDGSMGSGVRKTHKPPKQHAR